MKLLAVANLAGIEGHDTSEGAVAQLSKQLNTAFLVYRGLMSGELKKSPATSTNTRDPPTPTLSRRLVGLGCLGC